ncbi:MAG: S8 family peptidase, partial [Acidimicrobiia bacterium]|nr:S8 family peptidase [Acidimicrobiia bacterium]
MRSTPFGRAHLSIVVVAVTALVGALVTTSAPAGSVPAIAEPQFLTWDGEPHGDGYNHYLIELSEAAPEPTWLEVDEDRLVATDSPPGQVAPDEIADAVTGATATLTPAEIADEIARHPSVVTVKSLPFGIYAVAGTVTAEELAGLPGVARVATDPGLEAATVDPYYPSQWGLDNDGESTDPWPTAADADIDAPEGWHRTRGRGVVVAVIDSGADVDHPDLSSNIWRNSEEECGNGVDDDANGYADDCHGWDFANGSADLTDFVGHGTHVSGIIAAKANNGIGVAGVAYESQVMILKIGNGTPTLSAAIEAFAYAIDNGASVINASWVVDDPAAAGFLDTAIAAAGDAGILVVAAAGNEPDDIDSEPVFPAASPLANVITVGASTALDEPADWSAYGASSVDLYAPGEHIISTVPGGYGVYSGTSMAAPMVSGAAALLWAATPEASYAEVKGALLDRSDGPNDGITAFQGLATSDGRLNINRSIYSAPLFQPSLMFNFYEFNSFEPGIAHKVAITAKTVDPWIVPPQTRAMYRAGLYVPVDGQPMAVVGQEITFTGAGGDVTSYTDMTGRALVGREFERQQRPAFVQDGDFTPLAMELPAGTYAFVMEIVDVTNAENPQRMGDPSAVFFIVSDDGSVAEMPQIPISADPNPTPPTTPGSGDTTQPPGTVPSTTIAPDPATTTTASPPATSSTTTSTPGPATSAPPTTIDTVT